MRLFGRTRAGLADGLAPLDAIVEAYRSRTNAFNEKREPRSVDGPLLRLLRLRAYFLVAIAALLAAIGGALPGLVPIAFLTTRPNAATAAEPGAPLPDTRFG
jgi:hypothetical protein